jgi:hypothetical protein
MTFETVLDADEELLDVIEEDREETTLLGAIVL